MHLSERAVEYPRLVILGSLLLVLMGLVAIFTLPKERNPRVRIPVILVIVPNPGADPATNEREIIRRVEKEAGQLEHLKSRGSITSQAVHGAAVMQFVFDDAIEVKEAKRDVESLINRVKTQFPPEAQRDPGPIVNDIAFEDMPIIQVYVSGGRDGQHRRIIAERLKTQIEKADSGIAGVDIFGGLEQEVEIAIDPHRMAIYGFSYEQVAGAIWRANSSAPSGAIESAGGLNTQVSTDAKLKDIEAIRNIPLGTRESRPIFLNDVARVEMSHKPLTSMARYDGQDAAVLLVRAKTDIDSLAASNRVQAVVEEFVRSGQNQGTTIGTARSQAREISYMIYQLGSSAIYGTMLVIVILWITMGWRNAVLVGMAIPLALLGAAAFMWITKRTVMPDLAINTMTLFATILVSGMVVDGCIVVAENIYRYRELGYSAIEAAKRGISEVGGSLTGAYLTTFAAFGPMFLVRGIMGDFMKLLPVVVLFGLCAAMLVDHFLLPVLSVYVMKVNPKKVIAAIRKGEEENLTPAEVEMANAEAICQSTWIRRGYGRMLQYAMHHRLMILVLATAVTAAPVVAFKAGAIEFEFFPETDVPIIEVYFELPLGASMETRTVAAAEHIEKIVKRVIRPEEWYHPKGSSRPLGPVTTIGDPGALNVRLDVETGSGPEYGMVYCELELAENRDRTAAQIRQAITDEINAHPLPGVIVRVRSPQEGPPAGAPVLVRVLAEKEASLEELARKAQAIENLLKTFPGVYDVSSDFNLRPEIRVTPEPIIASLFHIDAAQINTSVNYALEGVRVGEVDFGGDEMIDLRIRNLPEQRDTMQSLADLPLRSQSGRVVSLDQVASIERVLSPNVIRHYDRQRAITIRAQVIPGVTPDQVKAQLVSSLRPELSPAQQRNLVMNEMTLQADGMALIEFGGENELRDEALEDLTLAMGIALAAMLMILTIQFNSFIQPLIILFAVPLSLVGVALGLMIFGFNFSVSAMIGVVALAGIVVNDAIMIIEFINQRYNTGLPIEKAVLYAGQLRLRPIMMTTITTIAGLLPLGLNVSGGGEFWQPLTISIMSGLMFVTLVQLILIPVLCYTINRKRSATLLDPAHRKEFLARVTPTQS